MKKLIFILSMLAISLSACVVAPYGDHDEGGRRDREHRDHRDEGRGGDRGDHGDHDRYR